MSELVLVVGHVGAGKTTRARELAAATGAVRLTPDEWMVPLFHHNNPPSAHYPGGMRDVLEGRLVWTAAEMLRAGLDVILDFGLWGREERAALNWLAGTLGASTRTEYVRIDPVMQAERVARRWRETPEVTWNVSQADLDRWRTTLHEPDADELSGVYTAPTPPDGGWRRWIAERWPTALAPGSAGITRVTSAGAGPGSDPSIASGSSRRARRASFGAAAADCAG